MEYNATPLSHLPNMPAQMNDPRIMNDVMMDTRPPMNYNMEPNPMFNHQPQQQPQQQYYKSSNNLFNVLKEPVFVAILYVLVNSEILHNFLIKYVPNMFTVDGQQSVVSIVIKSVIMGLIVLLGKYLI